MFKFNWRDGVCMRIIDKQAEEYLAYCETIRNYTGQTMKSKKYIIGMFVTQIDVESLEEVTNHALNMWRMNFLKAGISPRTVNTRTWHVIAFIKYFKDSGSKLNINLSHVLEVETDPVDKLCFTPKQVYDVLKCCRTERERLFISLKFETGLRLSELSKLRVEDISGNAVKTIGKGRKLRTTYMLDETRLRLEKWITRCGIEKGYIFPSPVREDKSLSVDQVRTVMKSVFRRAGITNFYPRALRDSFASALYHNGADVLTIQKLMGHSDLAVTTKYLHTLDNQLQSKHQEFMTYV